MKKQVFTLVYKDKQYPTTSDYWHLNLIMDEINDGVEDHLIELSLRKYKEWLKADLYLSDAPFRHKGSILLLLHILDNRKDKSTIKQKDLSTLKNLSQLNEILYGK